MSATFTASAKFVAVDRLSQPMRTMSAGVGKFGVKAETVFSRIERRSRRITKSFNKLLGVVGKLGLGFGALMIAQQIATANIALDDSLQSLQAITGVTGKAFKSFAAEIDNVSKRQLIFAGDTAKAFELVGSAKPELLASAEALSKVTEAAIILGKAGRLEVTDAVTSLTVSMNQFGAGAEKATMFVDILATAQQKGSGTIKFLSEAMINAGGTSKAFGNSFADTVAILEGFAKAGVPASEAGTQLAGILSKLSQVQNRNFNPQFTKATDIINNLAKANLSYTELLKLTDVRGAKWLTTIINQNEIVQKLTGNLNNTGNAQEQANIQMFSFGEILNKINSAFKNVISSTDSENKQVLKLKSSLLFVANNMEKIIAAIAIAISLFLAFKAALIIAKVAMIGYNVVFGISAALMGKSAFLVSANTIAYAAFRSAVIAQTAAQWLFNAAMNAGLWPVLGIMAAIGLLVLIVRSFIKNWELVKASFAQGGIIKGLITIGKVILDAILFPVQQLLQLLGKIPGLNIATTGAEKIEAFRNRLFEQERALIPQQTEELNTTKTESTRETVRSFETNNSQNVNVNVNNNNKSDISVDSPGSFPVTVSNTIPS